MNLILSKPDIIIGEEGLEAVATHNESNLLLTAIVGFAGVKPTLAAIKKDKIIVLTTHYMDEAEVLGDRIAIVSHGKL